MLVDLWQRFRGLAPSTTTLVANVTAHNPDGTSTLQTPEGYALRAVGTDVPVGASAYVREGRVIGAAASLPILDLTV